MSLIARFLPILLLGGMALLGTIPSVLAKEPASARLPSAKAPKDECEELMNAVLPLARRLLSKNHEFYPLGATMSASGKIALTAGWTGDEHPKSADVIAILEDGFRAGDAEGKFKATALVVDMRVVPPGESEKRDAVAVNLDHRDGYSVRVVFPYSFSNAGELLFERPFTLAGEKRIFSR